MERIVIRPSSSVTLLRIDCYSCAYVSIFDVNAAWIDYQLERPGNAGVDSPAEIERQLRMQK
jgi:hypothetical protein